MKTPSLARELDEIEWFDEIEEVEEVEETADTDTHVLDLTREEDREKLGRVVRIMSEQSVYAELAMLARTAKDKDPSKVFRPLDAASHSS